MLNKASRILFPIIALGTMLFLAGCPTQTTIADINKDPGRFAGKEITIRGTASNSFGAFGNGAFQVDDGTGTIWVYSQKFGVPGAGAKVTVTGNVEQGFSFGGRSFAVILKETQERR